MNLVAYSSTNQSKIIMGKTLFEKIWDAHIVVEKKNNPSLIYIDRHLIHEVTSPQAFD